MFMKKQYLPPVVDLALLQPSSLICASANGVGISNANEQDLSTLTWSIS